MKVDLETHVMRVGTGLMGVRRPLGLGVPSLANLVTSQVQPLSAIRATGLPTMTTPTIFSPSDAPTANSPPCGALWWRWTWVT